MGSEAVAITISPAIIDLQVSALYPPKLLQCLFPAPSRGFVLLGHSRNTALADFHFHDLRHEAISRLFERGLNICRGERHQRAQRAENVAAIHTSASD